MGLGKTFQVITFLYTILTHPKINKVVRKAMVVVPKNVVANWEQEFEKWVYDNHLSGIDVVSTGAESDLDKRMSCLKSWYNSKKPAVLIIGYEMYRVLVTDPCEKNKKGIRPKPTPARKHHKKLLEKFRYFLQDPGPDIVVCDEGHKLKNDESKLSLAMSSMKTRRRVCLTGTPMQNNLIEYHCMINFVKPGLLGTKKEFRERFVNVISKGQAKDAELEEVVYMKRRCHVLFHKLRKVLDRQDYRVLTESIPPKQEYVIHVRLTDMQIELYRAYVEKTTAHLDSLYRRLLSDYHILSRVWTHPYQLRMGDLDDMDSFIDDDEESDEDAKPKKKVKKNNFIDDGDDDDDADYRQPHRAESPYKVPPDWFETLDLVQESDEDNFALSNKLLVLMDIIKICEQIGDKLLIFSQSLESLALIKYALEAQRNKWFVDHEPLMKRSSERWSWELGKDFFIISGSVSSADRDLIQRRFNDSSRPRARVCLISTRAGSLGTNMVAANRVVVFDACWNPSHDTQALFRAYRYGQTKPVYVYRLIADGTMEDSIFKRQVTKESTSLRVIDEKQIQRLFTRNDLLEVYRLDVHPYNPDVTSVLNPPKDRLFGKILLNRPEAIYKYEERDTLLKHVVEEVLTAEERRRAWMDYETENQRNNMVTNLNNMQMTIVEKDFLRGIRNFAQTQMGVMSQNQMVDPMRAQLGAKLMDNGCDYIHAMTLQLMMLGLDEIVQKGPPQVLQEHPDLKKPDEFLLQRYLAHPPANSFELTLLDCRNKFKDLFRRFNHLEQLRATFSYLSHMPYLLHDYDMNQLQVGARF